MIVKAIIYDEKKMLKFGHKYKPDIIILDKGATEFLYHFKHYKVDMSCAWYYKRFFRLAAKLIYCVGNENPLDITLQKQELEKSIDGKGVKDSLLSDNSR